MICEKRNKKKNIIGTVVHVGRSITNVERVRQEIFCNSFYMICIMSTFTEVKSLLITSIDSRVHFFQ